MKARRSPVGLTASVALLLVPVLLVARDRIGDPPVSAPLEPVPDWMANGEGEANDFGYSVGAAGDVNRDGCDDLIVGACGYDNYTGRAYLYLGE